MQRYFAWFAAAAVCGTFQFVPGQAASAATVIVCPKSAPFAERLAAKEIRRYVYLRCGDLLPIAAEAGKGGDTIVLKTDPALGAEDYQLKTAGPSGSRVLTITGGSPIAVLYGAYHFAEKLGVRFYLHGDVVPDGRIPFSLPALDERHKPLFVTRGIQPFHDFPEGPDWWNQDDYMAYAAQLAKLKMNFLGMHTYPEHAPNPEPLVWIGLPQDVNPDGTVKFSYNSYWANTLRDGAWGYAPLKTSEFTCGAAQLFPDDAYGPDVMQGLMPHPKTPQQCNELFNRTGAEFRAVFALARKLGVKTCIGTETPLTIPDAVRAAPQATRQESDRPGGRPRTIRRHVQADCGHRRRGLLLAVDARGLDLGRQRPQAVRGDDPRHPRRLRRPGGGRQAVYAGHLRLGAGTAA